MIHSACWEEVGARFAIKLRLGRWTFDFLLMVTIRLPLQLQPKSLVDPDRRRFWRSTSPLLDRERGRLVFALQQVAFERLGHVAHARLHAR